MAKAKLYLDIRRALKDGTYPVKVRVTHDRKSKFFGTLYSFSEKEFKKIIGGKFLSQDQKKIEKKLTALEKKGNDIIEDLEIFSFEVFALRFTSKGDRNDLLSRFKEEINRNDKENRISKSNLNKFALVTIIRFLNRENPNYVYSGRKDKDVNQEIISQNRLPMISITPEWLHRLEKWQKERGMSDNTTKTVMTQIKVIMNNAIRKGEFDDKKYPFGKDKYSLPQSSSNSRDLKSRELAAFFQYTPKNEQEEFAKDLFIFSYLSSGMNMGDIFLLKWENFKGRDSFSFWRNKTKSKMGGKEKSRITIHVKPELWAIIEKHGSRKINNDYVFNVLTPDMSEKEAHAAKLVKLNFINRYLKKIGDSIGLEFKLTSYHARHTYASNLMRTAPLAYISKQLGHSNLTTTETYLGSFEAGEAKEYEADLIPKDQVV